MNPKIRLLSQRFKNSSHQQKQKQSISPQFKSKVYRSFIDQYVNRSNPGPGQYQVSLPLVKPRIQAIQKNKNSIIVKIHQRNTPAFQSLQPRFKQPKYQENINNSQRLGSDQQQMIHDLKRSKKSLHPKPVQHWRSKNSIPSIQSYIVDSTKQRNLLMNKKQSAKGTQWSKYLGQRNKWVKETQVPGPGFYGYAKIKQTQYYSPKNSWQFRSSTLRQAFNNGKSRYDQISKIHNEMQNFQRTNCIHSLIKE